MAIGDNIGIKDKLIRNTTDKGSVVSNGSVSDNVSKENNVISTRKGVTERTKKATFYIKTDLLQKLYNFAYWERYNVTEAFNIALADGLKNKTTKERDKN